MKGGDKMSKPMEPINEDLWKEDEDMVVTPDKALTQCGGGMPCQDYSCDTVMNCD